MSTPRPKSTPVQNPTTTQTPVYSGNAAADEAARQQKEDMKNAVSSNTSILTSGAGVLDDETLKKNTLGGGTVAKANSLG